MKKLLILNLALTSIIGGIAIKKIVDVQKEVEYFEWVKDVYRNRKEYVQLMKRQFKETESK